MQSIVSSETRDPYNMTRSFASPVLSKAEGLEMTASLKAFFAFTFQL
ncbi:MAG: hypothetical protein JRJ47_02920 [Deltaproteobacteria bacterium]|nr:hypothetical protein [Deltaproteobacteria bacterium]